MVKFIHHSEQSPSLPGHWEALASSSPPMEPPLIQVKVFMYFHQLLFCRNIFKQDNRNSKFVKFYTFIGMSSRELHPVFLFSLHETNIVFYWNILKLVPLPLQPLGVFSKNCSLDWLSWLNQSSEDLPSVTFHLPTARPYFDSLARVLTQNCVLLGRGEITFPASSENWNLAIQQFTV